MVSIKVYFLDNRLFLEETVCTMERKGWKREGKMKKAEGRDCYYK